MRYFKSLLVACLVLAQFPTDAAALPPPKLTIQEQLDDHAGRIEKLEAKLKALTENTTAEPPATSAPAAATAGATPVAQPGVTYRMTSRGLMVCDGQTCNLAPQSGVAAAGSSCPCETAYGSCPCAAAPQTAGGFTTSAAPQRVGLFGRVRGGGLFGGRLRGGSGSCCGG